MGFLLCTCFSIYVLSTLVKISVSYYKKIYGVFKKVCPKILKNKKNGIFVRCLHNYFFCCDIHLKGKLKHLKKKKKTFERVRAV